MQRGNEGTSQAVAVLPQPHHTRARPLTFRDPLGHLANLILQPALIRRLLLQPRILLDGASTRLCMYIRTRRARARGTDAQPSHSVAEGACSLSVVCLHTIFGLTPGAKMRRVSPLDTQNQYVPEQACCDRGEYPLLRGPSCPNWLQ